jgi:putative phosphoserine phosphatase/1-acylglycerol-3-phosphate O-acyltransferase
VYPPIPVDDWTHDNLPDRIAEVRQLYLDTLKAWPHDKVPTAGLYKRKKAPAKKAPAKKAPAKAAKKAAKKTGKKTADAPAKKAAKKTTKKAATKGRP